MGRKNPGGTNMAEHGVIEKQEQTSVIEHFLGERPVHAFIALSIVSLTVSLSLYHLFLSWAGLVDAYSFRSTHVCFVLVIAILFKPLGRKSWKDPFNLCSIIDFSLIAIVIITQIYILYDIDEFVFRGGNLTNWDVRIGSAMLFIVLEVTRRMVGWALVLIAGFFLLHTYLADHFFWLFYGPPNDWATIVDYLFMRENGIYGIPTMVMATYVFLFILFGAILMESGAGRFFINLALALTGGRKGGPAKASILASTLMATISGAAVANVVVTGTFTIPLMKRIGYRPQFAGAVEACASGGGQIMPPVMGASAFLIAEFLAVPYLDVCLAAIFPAILYMFSVYIMVHFEAGKYNLPTLKKEEMPSAKEELKKGGHLFLSVLVIIVLLASGYTPMYAAFWAIISVFALSSLRKETRMTPIKMLKFLESGALKALPVSISCACAGIVIGSIFVSGLGLKFTHLIVTIADGQLWIALILTMFASLILGMGLVTVAVYITVAALVVPALVTMGVTPVAAHFFAFYFGLVCNITPPVALAAFAAAGIAGSNPMRTGFSAMRLGISKYLLPFVFVFSPGLLFVGPWWEILRSFAAASIGIFAVSLLSEGWLYDKIKWHIRLFMIIPSGLLFLPYPAYNLLGLILFAGTVFLLRSKRPQAALQS
ncbi:MAG: TRAP transporter permease [Deltaproteobacteria bacterium]|nr:TRAP transporter permease [Deltaproteobacteria bacterium]